MPMKIAITILTRILCIAPYHPVYLPDSPFYDKIELPAMWRGVCRDIFAPHAPDSASAPREACAACSFPTQRSNVRVGRMPRRQNRKRKKSNHAAKPQADQKADDKIRHSCTACVKLRDTNNLYDFVRLCAVAALFIFRQIIIGCLRLSIPLLNEICGNDYAAIH